MRSSLHNTRLGFKKRGVLKLQMEENSMPLLRYFKELTLPKRDHLYLKTVAKRFIINSQKVKLLGSMAPQLINDVCI